MHHRQGNTNYHHPCLVMTQKIHPKGNLEPWWNKTSVFLKKTSKFPGTTMCQRKLTKRLYGTIYRFQEEDEADATSFAPSDQGRNTRQFPSSEHHKDNKFGYESAPTQSKEEDFTTKISPTAFRPVSFK